VIFKEEKTGEETEVGGVLDAFDENAPQRQTKKPIRTTSTHLHNGSDTVTKHKLCRGEPASDETSFPVNHSTSACQADDARSFCSASNASQTTRDHFAARLTLRRRRAIILQRV
jgi:hypothetical protein